MSDYDVTHEDMLVVLRPSGPGIDALADLIARLVAEETVEHTNRFHLRQLLLSLQFQLAEHP
jgi:hypothetical protein